MLLSMLAVLVSTARFCIYCTPTMRNEVESRRIFCPFSESNNKVTSLVRRRCTFTYGSQGAHHNTYLPRGTFPCRSRRRQLSACLKRKLEVKNYFSLIDKCGKAPQYLHQDVCIRRKKWNKNRRDPVSLKPHHRSQRYHEHF